MGLSQWSGTVDSPLAASLSSFPELSADDQQATISELATFDSLQPASISELNVQVDGVDEADAIQFDGDYLYIADGNQIRIVATDNVSPSSTLVNTLNREHRPVPIMSFRMKACICSSWTRMLHRSIRWVP